jgi:antitoxin component of MazEF toxin-antitoxin module
MLHGHSLVVTLPPDWCRGHHVVPGTALVVEYDDTSVILRATHDVKAEANGAVH